MKQYFSIINKAYIWLTIAAVVVTGALWLFFSNMRFSIQFTGGMEVVIDQSISADVFVPVMTDLLEEAGYTNVNVGIGQKDGYDSVLLQIAIESDKQVDEVTNLVQEALLSTNTIASIENILESSITGPSIGAYITKTAKNALIRGMILIAFYILFAFSGMRALISPALLGFVTVVTMLFDVGFAAGAYGLLMQLNPAVQVDTIFIIALLTVLGYSVNDTIVIFDRIRENFVDQQKALEEGRTTRAEVFEASIWQTMSRSIATSFSTLLVIIGMYIFGTGILKMFAFTMGAGVIAGSYSSIFLAAPFAYLLTSRVRK